MSGVLSCYPPATEFPRECSRWHLLSSTCHCFPAKACQVSFPAAHLPRNSRESVPGGISCRPPATVFPQKRSRCPFLLPTCHGIPAKAFQVAPLAAHLARKPCKSVPGGISCRPPGTETLQKRSRCPSLPLTWHGIPAKAFQVASPCLPPATETLQKRVRCPSLPPIWHGIPAKAFQVSFPASHLPRFSRKSVAGSTSRRPPGTESPQKRSRCPFLPPTCHGIPAKAFQVAPLAAHLPRNSRKSVPGVSSRRPPGTVFPRKRVR